jgi:hypothetical protein
MSKTPSTTSKLPPKNITLKKYFFAKLKKKKP